MKHTLLLLVTFLMAYSSYSQDFLGAKLADLRINTKHLKGVKCHFRGDSIITVKNAKLGRSFEFKFDYLTHVCYEEEIHLDLADIKNLNIAERFLKSEKLTALQGPALVSYYETASKKIEIIRNSGQVLIKFNLKNNDEAIITKELQSSVFPVDLFNRE